eukprot:scaffold2549_cov333-Pavlova_lutheri.AAC.16
MQKTRLPFEAPQNRLPSPRRAQLRSAPRIAGVAIACRSEAWKSSTRCRCVPGTKAASGSREGRGREATRTCFVRAVRALVLVRPPEAPEAPQRCSLACLEGNETRDVPSDPPWHPTTRKQGSCSVRITCRELSWKKKTTRTKP